VVLRDRREPLIKQILEAVMISLHQKAAPPQIQSPVADSLDEPDKLPLVSGEGTVTGRDGTTEEGDRVAVLDEDRAEAVRRSIAFDDKGLVEVRHGEDGC
jgi:hypothetical protein